MENKTKRRETFSSGLAVFFATLGSAVGLGNIWKFPYMVGANGGGTFLVIYLICVALVGIPVMLSEFYIGRRTHKNVMGAIGQLTPKNGWKSIGVLGMGAGYLIMFFYTCIAGWVYYYIFKALKGDFANLPSNMKQAGDIVGSEFGKAVVGPTNPIIWQIIAVIVVSLILIAGVQKGIERVTKTLIPVLFVLIIICAVRALILQGASEGVKFLFHVDFSMVTPVVVLSAMGLAFFKLSIGMGTMVTYGSYFTDDNNMLGTSVKVALSDIAVSLLAGLAIFPTVFTFGMKPGAGPGLLFQTIPLIFSKLPFGRVLLVAFFILTAIAATTAMISIVEVIIAYFTEQRGMSRKKAVLINAVIIIVFGLLATLSAAGVKDSVTVIGKFSLFGKGFFDLFDYVSSNIFMTIGGLLIAIFVGWMVKKQDIYDEFSNHGALKNEKVVNLYYFLIRYITPLLIIVVFLYSIGVIKL